MIVTLPLVAAEAAAQSADDTADPAWSFSVGVYTYVLPDEGNYAQPTFTADRSALHLEARYNYEATETGSLWAGYNLGGGDRVAWELTPMIGGVFGTTNGVAPGYKASLSWWKLEAYSEGEYVFATEAEERFAYNWSEVAIAPVEWLRAGVVAQRTRAYDAERDIQRGPFVGASFKGIDSAVYLFNPDDDKPTVVVAVTWSF
jgi:hypothetical protein